MFFLLIKEAGYDRRNLFTKQYKNRICKSRGKTKYYDNGNLNKWNGIEIYKYKYDKLSEIVGKHGNNKTFIRSAFYSNKEIPQNSFTKEGLTYNTTPEGYIEYLKQNKIDYKISPDKKNSSVMIYEFNKDNKKTQTTHFCKHGVSRTELNSNEEEVKHIDLRKEKTEVTNYLDTSEIKSPLK